ncbi:efflux RND transporter periplasmic adaptor subunit [Pseudoalteromonas viridis]|uniref:HlyD family efflux transporter periplasmic adaptor subunit n=1 Tax=Pseudoalteromonas viridis TaxID=339617 RepID=A0ABX7VA36_9GAMM|nr:HlyD family efflux transporter periplasmic adaptor subunit [Pseudoalteromonas viridis]QTL37783.1 HlyD family efflux transporter periplasmic adaptor subunit [Pseudoalteromonas viridis]
MDIQRELKQPARWKKLSYVLPVVVLALGYYAVQRFTGDASYFVDRETVVTAKVEQGDFQVNVRATGVLKPAEIRWVAAQVSGRVEQVLVKAGAEVTVGQLLLKLSNPQLQRELEQARWELEAARAENNATIVALESQLVELDNQVVSAELGHQAEKLKLDAETLLIEQGNATVSQLDYQKSQLAVKREQQRWQAARQKALKMRAEIAATKAAQTARSGLLENNLRRMQEQVDALQVRADKAGVVQQISLELGEQVSLGGSIALLASQQNLYAELQVPEVRVQDIQIGQSVTLDTRNNEITGTVARIDPAVENGMVLVDVALPASLPADARPELTVDAQIQVSHLSNTLYVRRPTYAPKSTQIQLYKLDEAGRFAHKTAVALGQVSVNRVQIVSGLSVGDEVIISDSSDWQDHAEIKLN